MKTMTRRFGLQIIAATAAAPVAAAAPHPDAELIELGRQFVEFGRLRDAASEEALRLYEMGADNTAAEEAFDGTMDQLRTIFARMISMRPTTIEGMRAIALAVLHFEWGGNVEYGEGAIEGAALAVLVAGLLDKPLPDRLPDWAAAWI
ncbi:hypothetical protein [Bradyrhizobium brasilense]|uniref:hypothetical protein n=1 Tax=Bradyrhizobium brasilense TaxID=1419277 RepID=UPI001E2D996E|nr:hypothetical protein [Bradyrhizobium brasilense]MCC8976469.1 hypothetical protein [Bradyrhizobium brasilense]